MFFEALEGKYCEENYARFGQSEGGGSNSGRTIMDKHQV
jgi:hypothetical protein